MIPHTSPILYFTLSGFLLRFSWPPFDVPLSLAAGLILSAAAISNANYKHSIIGGAIVGGLWNSYLLIGLLPWGIYFAFGAWLISVFIMSIFYLLTKIIYTKMTPALGGISISLAWTCIMYITQTLHYPIALTPTLVRSTPEIASSLSNLGFFAGEFLIILFTFSATLYFYQLRFALIALLVATALRNWLLILNNETPETHTDIAIVQPAIRAESFFAASNNLYQRRKIEKSLDNLTYSAASQNAQLIVWPEAANGLPNFNLPNRVKTTRNILSQTKSELLITGYEYNSAGKKFNTAYLISSDSAIQRAQKKNHRTIN